MLHDLKHGLRNLLRKPLLTGLAVATLALAIGAGTAMYSVVDGVLIQPLPFEQPDRLVRLWEQNPERGWYRQSVSGANFLDWQERAESFEDMAAYLWGPEGRSLTGYGGEARRIEIQAAGENLFQVLGVEPLHGRLFPQGSTWAGSEATILLSHDFFQQTFGGDSNILGTTIHIDQEPHRILGVMPPGFRFPEQGVDAWTSFAWDPAYRDQTWFRRAHFLKVVARLKPGIEPSAAEQELQVVAAQLEREYPETNRLMGAGLTPLHEWVVGDTRPALLLLLGAVGLVLLVACANVVHLLLVQAGGRRREMALRAALGAGRRRLLRLLLTEHLLLAGAAGLAGAWLGHAMLRGIVLLEPDVPRLHETTLDARVLWTALVLGTLTTLLVSIVPALAGARFDLRGSLYGGSRSSADLGPRRLRHALAVGEVALALVLLVGAGALGHSFYRLYQVDPGFDTENLLAVRLTLPEASYPEAAAVEGFFDRVVERVEALPGVRSASSGDNVPLLGSSWTADFHLEGEDVFGIEAQFLRVDTGYFETLGLPLASGRPFDTRDRTDSEPVAIVSESLARQFSPDRNPVGRRMAFDREPGENTSWYTIVGVVGDLSYRGPRTETPLVVYQPTTQDLKHSRELLVRADGDALALVPSIRSIVRDLDADLPLMGIETLDGALDGSFQRERFVLTILLGFGAVALFLASLGIYGVMAVAVLQRRREIGIRMALGADGSTVVRQVLWEGLSLTMVGLGLGLGLSYGLTRYLGSLLYEVEPLDPLSLAGGCAVLVVTALLASWIPALRASRVDPMTTLRCD